MPRQRPEKTSRFNISISGRRLNQEIVETLLAKAQEIAAQMEADGQVPATATGPVVVPIW